MSTFVDYKDARAFAERRAVEWKTPQGIEKRKEYGKVLWLVRSLPRRDKRYGVDLLCEAVEP